MKRSVNVALVLIVSLSMGLSALAATIQPQHTPKKKSTAKVTETTTAQRRKTTISHSRRQVHSKSARVRRRYYERFTGNSFIDGDQGLGDNTAGEDPVVRAAAIDALGNI